MTVYINNNCTTILHYILSMLIKVFKYLKNSFPEATAASGMC